MVSADTQIPGGGGGWVGGGVYYTLMWTSNDEHAAKGTTNKGQTQTPRQNRTLVCI